MRLIVRPAAARNSSSLDASDNGPRLLPPETNRWEEFSGNLVALIGAVFGQAPGKGRGEQFFAIATQTSWDPRDSMMASVMCHAAVVLTLLNLTALLHFAGQEEPKRPRFQNQRLEWYQMTTQLPSIAAGAEEAKPQESGGKPPEKAREGATVFHPQTVVSNPANPDNNQQTIFQPDAPNVRITQTQALPNVVIWNDIAKPAPPVDLVSRQLNALKMPGELVRRNAVEEPPLAKLELPVAAMPVAKLPDAPPPDVPMPPAPDATAVGANGDADGRLKKLVVMNANPAPPGGPIDVPEGNRAGAFSAGPNGRAGTPNGSPTASAGGGSGGPAPAGDGSLGGKRDLSSIRVPGLSVIGGTNGPVSGPVVSGPPPAAPPPATAGAPRPGLPSAPSRGPIDPKALFSRSVPRPQLPEIHAPKFEPGFTPGKRIYTVLINMPNLSSGGGGSWVLRFAELELRAPVDQIEIAAPVAMRKIDPGYAPEARREKIEGNVKLHAIIRRDGRVERVEVLHSLDSRLDQRAVEALLRWEFQPALRQGRPVDLEAVIEIPFKLPVVYK